MNHKSHTSSESEKRTGKARTVRILTRFFILIMISSMFSYLCMAMLDSTLSLYATDMWSSGRMGGYLTSFFNAGSILMAFFSGRVIDRYGRRRILVLSSIAFAIPTFAMGWLPYRGFSLAARFIQGCARGLVNVSASTIVSEIVPTERLGEGMGLYGVSQTLPRALGPVIGITITASGNYRLMFFVCAMAYLIAAGAASGITYEKDPACQDRILVRKAAAVQTDTYEYHGIWRLVEKKAMMAAFNYTLYFASTAVIMVFLAAYAREILAIDSSRIGYFFTISALAILVIRLFCGKISDRYGALTVVIPGHLFIIGALTILDRFAMNSYGMFLLAGVLYGCSTAIMMPVMNAVAVQDSPAHRNGTANATFFCMMDIGMLVASAVVGMIIDAAGTPAEGYHTAIVISTGVTFISMAVALIFNNKKARARRRAL